MARMPVDERRTRIIDAAVEILASDGLGGLTTRRIAERANAPLGSLHYCFRNKAELVELVEARGAQLVRAEFESVDPSRGVEATIRDSIAALWRWFQANMGLQMALYELAMRKIRLGGDPEKVYAMWQPFGRDLLTERLTAALAAEPIELGVTIEEMVRFILHRFDGLAFEFAASRDLAACERQTELLADALVAVALPAAQRV